jgi:hypothetical protein
MRIGQRIVRRGAPTLAPSSLPRPADHAAPPSPPRRRRARLAARQAFAQAHTLRLVVPYPPGGPLYIVARALAERVKDSLNVVGVENRPGAGGNLGADLVAKSAPDGYTLLMGAVATHAINPWLYAKMPYDALRDFTPITLVARVPNVPVMNVDTAARLAIANGADLVAYAKKHPGKLNVGSGCNGSAGHLAAEKFKARAGPKDLRSRAGKARVGPPTLRSCAGASLRRARPASAWSTSPTPGATRRSWHSSPATWT